MGKIIKPQADSSSLINTINKHIRLNKQEMEKLDELIVYKMFKKNQYLSLKETNTANSYYVISGFLQTFFLDEKGNEHILLFSPPDWWTGDICNFYQDRNGSLLNIKALQQTEVAILTQETKEILFNYSRNFERYFRILAERSLVAFQYRLLDVLSSTVDERYRNFVKKYATLIPELSQKQIAGYIGASPEFLSKIKNQIKSIQSLAG